jgi:hypothetical protein
MNNEMLVMIGFDATLEGAKRATSLSAFYLVAFQRSPTRGDVMKGTPAPN